jgi:hypothetical protein
LFLVTTNGFTVQITTKGASPLEEETGKTPFLVCTFPQVEEWLSCKSNRVSTELQINKDYFPIIYCIEFSTWKSTNIAIQPKLTITTPVACLPSFTLPTDSQSQEILGMK